MSASIVGDPIVMATPQEGPPAISKVKIQMEVESADCWCCGLTEECTPAYIDRIRARYNGRWICGLCAEAVKEEMARKKRVISTEEAVSKHKSFCKKFLSAGPPPDPTVHLISAMRQVLRKSLDSPRSFKSNQSNRDVSLAVSLEISDACLSLVENQSGSFL